MRVAALEASLAGVVTTNVRMRAKEAILAIRIWGRTGRAGWTIVSVRDDWATVS